MYLTEGTCLNEVYAQKVKEIYKHLKEAKDLYDSLPPVIKNVNITYGDNDVWRFGLDWYLRNGEACAKCFAKEFGVEIIK